MIRPKKFAGGTYDAPGRSPMKIHYLRPTGVLRIGFALRGSFRRTICETTFFFNIIFIFDNNLNQKSESDDF